MQRIEHATLCVFLCLVWGCAPTLTGSRHSPGTSDASGALWKPPPELEAPPVPSPPPPQLPEGYSLESLQAKDVELSLPLVLEVALANNPVTMSAWAQAKVAAAQLGVAQAGWLPRLSLDAQITRMSQAAVGGRFEFQITQATASFDLSWLLFDFGAREANIESARYALIAANLSQNQVVLDLKYQVEQTYVQYVDAQALVLAQEQSLEAAAASLSAAKAREAAGLGTLADVLQAQTALSQARLTKTSYEGQVESLQGALATAMGLPATLDLKVKLLPPELPEIDLTQKIDPLIERAMAQRPALSALWAQVASEEARARLAQRSRYPRLVLGANYTPTYFFNAPPTGQSFVNNYTYGVGLQLPLFTGFANQYEVNAARASAEGTAARAATLAQEITLEVWTAYVELQTASEQLKNAKDLLASAQASFDVAQGRYGEGVGSILDLLSAQSSLALARALSVQARSRWYLAFARLSHAVGASSLLENEAGGESPGRETP